MTPDEADRQSVWRKAPGNPLMYDALLACLIAAAVTPSAGAQTVLRQWAGTPQSSFGRPVAGLGDVDGDGVPDVGIGAPSANVGGATFAGRAHVFSTKTGAQLFVTSGTQAYQLLGTTVVGPGDIDQDGQMDFLIGSGNALPPLSLFSGATGGLLGTFSSYWTAAGPGDVDRDGVPDLLLGNSSGSSGIEYAGEAAVVSGKTGSVVHSYTGTFVNQGFGGIVSAAGDVDADGAPDLLVGAVGNWPFTGAGGAWVYSGASGQSLFYLAPPAGSNTFPSNLAGLGDVNADGYDDVAVYDYGPRFYAPYHHIEVFGGPAGAKLFTLQSPWPQRPWLGDSLTGPGDVDGDGHADILAGYGRSGVGQAFLFSGRDQSVLFSWTQGTSSVGAAVAGVGDVDGDDFPDLLISGFFDPVTQMSVVRLYSGASDGVSAFGLGCPDGRGVVPRIGASYRPELGGAFALNLSRVPPGVPATLILGASNRTWAGFGLPLDLAPFGLAGCSLLVSADLLVPVQTLGTAGKGWASVPLSIPSAPALVGAGFFAQWLVLGGGQAPPSLTRGLEVTVQANT